MKDMLNNAHTLLTNAFYLEAANFLPSLYIYFANLGISMPGVSGRRRGTKTHRHHIQ